MLTPGTPEKSAQSRAVRRLPREFAHLCRPRSAAIRRDEQPCAASSTACSRPPQLTHAGGRTDGGSCRARPCSRRCAPMASRTLRYAAAGRAAPPAASAWSKPGLVDAARAGRARSRRRWHALSAKPEGVRLACQIRPTVDVEVTPLLAAYSQRRRWHGARRDGRPRTAGHCGVRRPARLHDARRGEVPYDVLYLLNQFFHEMTGRWSATGGHYCILPATG